MSRKYAAYAGAYTGSGEDAIHIFDVDVEEGILTKRGSVPSQNATYLHHSSDGKFLYAAANEGLVAFAVRENGDLEELNRIGLDGMRGSYITVDKSGRYMAVAGFHDGKVTLVRVLEDGWLGGVLDGVYHKALGTVGERNFHPRVSCVQMTPDDKYICAVDNGIDQIKIYKITKSDKLALVDIVRFKRESGPREICFSPDGRFAYVLCSLMNCIVVFSYDGSGDVPVFEKLQTVVVSSKDTDELHDVSFSLCVSEDGKHVFASTAGEDTVSMFDVDQETGLLTKRFALPISGEYPKDITLYPGGKMLACVNNESNTITSFTVDYEKGIIIMKGKPVNVKMPNCLLIAELPSDN